MYTRRRPSGNIQAMARGLQELWTTRTRPTPLLAAELLGDNSGAGGVQPATGAVPANGSGTNSSGGSASRHLGLVDPHKLWSVQVPPFALEPFESRARFESRASPGFAHMCQTQR